MPDYKYQKNLEALPSCPPSVVKAQARVCYRFVKSPPAPGHFLPVTLENPRRGFANQDDECHAWGLSLWGSVDQAKRRFALLALKHPKLRKKWTHVAKVSLTAAHGAHNTPNSTGHFTLFEYVDTDLSTIAEIVAPL